VDLDFVVDLDQIWPWIGYSEKGVAKRALLKAECLEENKDYVIQKSLDTSAKQSERGGQNRETILLTINAFKKFCMMAGTRQAYKMHDYYIKLEQCLFETHEEENNSLKLQLKNKDSLRELTLIKNFHLKHVLYLIKITKDTVKFGYSNDIQRRLREHKSQIGNSISLEFCIETMYNVELEKTLKTSMNIVK
jgi:hypothetical protein